MERGPTSSGDDAVARPKSGRAGKPKVRTGCKTCKIRRVKCDEGKPSCKRCLLTGRICDGYPHLKRRQSNPVLFPQAKPASLILKIKPQDSIPVHPLDYPDWTPAELRSFEYFRCCTASVMSHWVRGPFWKYQLPQLGMSEITIRKAMIGFAKYHEGCERFRVSMQSGRGIDETDTDVLSNGVEEYNTAVSQLAKLLAKGKSVDIVALITCGLFIILDVGWGNYPKAIMHIHNGVKILDRWKKNLLMSNQAIAAGSLEQSVIDLFSNISHQTSLDDPDPLTALRTEWPPFEEFTTLDMAEQWHEHINRKSIQLIRVVVLGGRNNELDNILADIRTRESWWARSFKSLVASLAGKLSLEEDETVDELWIRHLIPEVMLWSSLNEENGEPGEVINSLLRRAEGLHRKRIKHDREMLFKIFCFVGGLIPALRIISHNSKDEAYRRKATLIYSWSAPSMLQTSIHGTPPKKGGKIEKGETGREINQVIELELRPGTQQVRLILNAGQKDGKWEVTQEPVT